MKDFWIRLAPHRRAAVLELFFVYFELGVAVILLGSVLPELRENNGLSYAQSGNLLSVQSIGFLLVGLVTGTAVLKAGMKRAYVLFIAAGAFHVSKPSDLIPELQGRFPVRVSLKPLTKEDFKAILSQTDNALTRQYAALLGVDHVHLTFDEDALKDIAEAAFMANETGEDIGARRLHAVFEELLEDISFNAGGEEMPDVYLNITPDYVREHLSSFHQPIDTKKYIL